MSFVLDSPLVAEAAALAKTLLTDRPRRLRHCKAAGRQAAAVARRIPDQLDGEAIAAAALLHDIGYVDSLARTGFHPLDGGLYLRAAGHPERLAALIAHHSLACLMAPEQVVDELDAHFPQEHSLLVDALVFSDMHSAPDGRIIRGETRLADIAARRPTEYQARRATGLRAAMGRVGAAILAVSSAPPDSTTDEADAESDLDSWWIQEARRCVAAAEQAGPDPVESTPR